MKNLFKKFYYFIKNKLNLKKEKDSSNYIMFESDTQTGMPNIKVGVADTSEESSEKFAEMLYSINDGLYTKSIVDLLIDIGHQDEEINKYIKSTMIRWKIFTAKAESVRSNSNMPLIKPTDFNKYVNKQ